MDFFNLDLAPFSAVMIFIVFDILSGLVKAGSTGTLSSSAMREGLWHKSALVILESVALASSLICNFFQALPSEFGAVYVGISGYIVIMEVISILENVAVANPELAGGKLYEIFGVNDEKNGSDWNGIG